MNTKKGLLALVLLSGLILYFSCTKDHTSNPAPIAGCDSTFTYKLRTKHVLDMYCGTSTTASTTGLCHDPSSANIGTHIGVYVYLYDSAHAANIFSNANYNAICYVEQSCTPAMPYLAYNSADHLPDSLQIVPADTVNVLKCWIQNGCD